MQQTIKFLESLNHKPYRRKASFSGNYTLPSTILENSASKYNTVNQQQPASVLKKRSFPFGKVFDFSEQKFMNFPTWLTKRQDFMDFMYEKYEKKLLSIPKICEKKQRASDQRFFIKLYLQKIDMFKDLPNIIMDIILDNIGVRYYKEGQLVHDSKNQMEFMGIVFVGKVQYSTPSKSSSSQQLAKDSNTSLFNFPQNKIIRQKDQIVFSQAFYKVYHPTTYAKQQTVILTLDRSVYKTIQFKLLEDIVQKSRDQIADLLKSDFFIELHLKDKKAKAFFNLLLPQFYFKDLTICEAGQEALNFYILFSGQIIQKDLIYLREHNKWPLPNRRWQVRAVYNCYQNAQTLNKFSFFGDEQLISNTNLKSSYITKAHSILFSINRDNFKKFLTNEDFKRLKKYRNEHININYGDFEKEVRGKAKSEKQRKKIIHKAIDTSFSNRKAESNYKKVELINKFQQQMLTSSIISNKAE